MPWHDSPMMALDLESTGLDPTTARIIDLALVIDDPDADGPDLLIDTLVDPTVEIPDEVVEITGIATGDVQGAPTFAEIAGKVAMLLEIAGEVGIPVAIYNAPYDVTLLEAELSRLSPLIDAPTYAIVDPLVLDRHVDRYRKGSRRLGDVADHYGVTLNGAHRARADATATVDLARTIGARHDELSVPLDALHKIQTDAHTRWRDGYNAYRARQGDPPITDGWPRR